MSARAENEAIDTKMNGVEYVSYRMHVFLFAKSCCSGGHRVHTTWYNSSRQKAPDKLRVGVAGRLLCAARHLLCTVYASVIDIRGGIGAGEGKSVTVRLAGYGKYRYYRMYYL